MCTCTCIHRKFFVERAGTVVSTWLALNCRSANIVNGISRNSTKYCNAGAIVVVIYFWMQRFNRSISMVIWNEVRAIVPLSLILWYNFVKCHSQHRYHQLIYLFSLDDTDQLSGRYLPHLDSLPPFNRQQYAILGEFYFPNVTTFSLLIVWQVEVPESTSATNGSW